MTINCTLSNPLPRLPTVENHDQRGKCHTAPGPAAETHLQREMSLLAPWKLQKQHEAGAISQRWHKVISEKRRRLLTDCGEGRREKAHAPGTAPWSWCSGVHSFHFGGKKEVNRFWAIASLCNTGITRRLYIKIY